MPVDRERPIRKGDATAHLVELLCFCFKKEVADGQCSLLLSYSQAAHPERIFVGICWQYHFEEDADCFVEPYPRPQQVREIRLNWTEAKGELI